MRPPVGVDAALDRPPRSRKSSADMTSSPMHVPGSGPTGPTAFFLRTEKELDKSIEGSSSRVQDSSYGVESLEETLEAAFGDAADKGDKAADDDHDKGLGILSSRKEKRSASSTSPSSKVKRSPHAKALGAKEVSSPSAQPSTTNKNVSPPLPARLRRTSNGPSTGFLTPFRVESPASNSAIPGTPKSISMRSFRLSDEDSVLDEVTSQAIMSSDEEEEDEGKQAKSNEQDTSDGMPQLVMPSIQMPKRRPFTMRGKSMGRLKVLIAGNTGLGKTSLIRSLVQLCEDIVHVNPLTSGPISPPTPPSPPKARSRSRQKSATAAITEIYASTKAYPPWWSEALDSHKVQRRNSLGDTVLERNLCFIDTPGLDASPKSENLEAILGFMEGLLQRNYSIGTMADADVLAALSGSGGVQVDLVLYLFSHDLDPSKEIENFKRLSQITNVLPLISHADKLEPRQISSLKNQLLSHFHLSSIRPFLFGKSVEDISRTLASIRVAEDNVPDAKNTSEDSPETTQILSPLPPLAISSKLSSDSETMDASLLMSSDYIQPLVQSDLRALVAQILDPENMAWLRHTSAKKFLQWRNRLQIHQQPSNLHSIGNTPSVPHSLRDPFSINAPFSGRSSASSTSSLLSSPSPSQVLVPHGHSPFYALSDSAPGTGTPTDFLPTPLHNEIALTRLSNPHHPDHDRYSHLRLAKWAADLQRSLRNERERFAQLEHSQRAQWLLERVGEEFKDGRIVAAPALTAGTSPQSPPSDAEWAVVRHGMAGPGLRGTNWAGVSLDPRDPLGLCDFGDGLRRSGMVLVGAGAFGAICFAVVKVWGESGFTWVGPEGWWGWIAGGERR